MSGYTSLEENACGASSDEQQDAKRNGHVLIDSGAGSDSAYWPAGRAISGCDSLLHTNPLRNGDDQVRIQMQVYMIGMSRSSVQLLAI